MAGPTPSDAYFPALSGTATYNKFVTATGVVTTAATLKLGFNSLTLTHGQTCVLTMPALLAGAWCKLFATQDTVTPFNGLLTHTGVKKPGGGAIPAQTATTGALDEYIYYCNGTIWVLEDINQAIA